MRPQQKWLDDIKEDVNNSFDSEGCLSWPHDPASDKGALQAFKEVLAYLDEVRYLLDMRSQDVPCEPDCDEPGCAAARALNRQEPPEVKEEDGHE